MPLNFAAKAAITAGLMVAQIALGAMRKIEGPRLDTLKTTTAEYGTPIDDFYGMRKLTGLPMIWADDLREEKKTSKTKGGKYSEYLYFGNWAVAIAGHEIEAVRRIWMDEHLVYQMAGAGPISVAGILRHVFGNISNEDLKLTLGTNIRIYKGTETQQPDRLIEAWMEDHEDFGANCVSAMRGVSYIVFQDIPLEKFGNRIPQITVEAVRNKTTSYLHEEIDDAGFSEAGSWTFNGSWGYNWRGSGAGAWWDLATRTKVGTSPTPGYFSGSVDSMAMAPDGTIHYYGVGVPAGTCYSTCKPLGFPTLTEVGPGSPSISHEKVRFLQSINIGVTGFYGNAVCGFSSDSGYMIGATHIIDPARSLRDSCEDEDGPWGLFQPMGASDEFIIEQLIDAFPISYSFNSGEMRADVTSARITPLNGKFIISGGDGNWYHFDKETETVTVNEPAPWGSTTPGFNQQGSPTWWHASAFKEYDLETGDVLQDYARFDWDVPNGDHDAYDPVNHAIWFQQTASEDIIVAYLERIGSGDVTLQTIVEEEGERVGCEIDGSDLDQLIPGYSVGPGPAKDRISPLLDLHDSLLRPHDFGIQGIKRGTSSVAEIPVGKFVRDGNSTRYEVDITQDGDLPQRLEVKYAALNNDQELNNVIAIRHTQAVDTSRVQQIDLSTYADTPDAMQQKADRFLRRTWNSRSVVKNGLTSQYLAAEPGDIYDLDLDGVTWTCELEKQTFSGGAINCEWRRTFPSLASLGLGTAPDTDGRSPDVILIPSQTVGFVLDIPLILDGDNDVNPLLYVAAGKITSNWTGAVVWDGSDGTYDDDVGGFDTSQASTWGVAQDTLADANPCLWDRGNDFEVVVYGGTLSSSTEAAINADPTINRFAIGDTGRWEICNFTTATLTDSTTYSRTYTISGLLRGRRGTELNTGNHDQGDKFLMLEEVRKIDLGMDAVNDNLSYRIQSAGLDPETTPAIDIEPFTAATLKPYAPVIENIQKLENGNIEIRIRTRTRVGGTWNGSTIPTGETIAEYEFDVLDGADVVRTLESTDKTFLYEAASQVTDFGSEIDADELAGFAYQLSASVGRGFERAA